MFLEGCTFPANNIITGAPKQNVLQSDASELKVVLNYYTWEKSELTNPIITEFEKKYPNIKVNVNLIPDTANSTSEKLDRMALGGGDIDIWPMNNQFLRMKNGLIRNIDDYIKRDGLDMKKSFGAAATSVMYNGKYYGFPYISIVPMIFYNKDMFDKAGIPYPTDSWTYTELYNTAKKLTQGSGTNKVYGFMENWFMVTGGRPGKTPVSLYDKNGLSNFSVPYWVEPLKLRKKMEQEGIELPFSKVQSKATYSSIEFLSGRAAMTFGASWVVRDMKDKQRFPFHFRVGCVLPPRATSSTENIKQITSVETILSIPVTSRHPEEAYQFIKFYVENGSEAIANLGNVPQYTPAYSEKLVKIFAGNSGLSEQDAKRFFITEGHYVYIPEQLGATEYENAIEAEVGNYLMGNKSLSEALASLKARADSAIIKEKNHLRQAAVNQEYSKTTNQKSGR